MEPTWGALDPAGPYLGCLAAACGAYVDQGEGGGEGGGGVGAAVHLARLCWLPEGREAEGNHGVGVARAGRGDELRSSTHAGHGQNR